MKKQQIFTIELIFILIAASVLFIVTVHQMSTDGILPGNDPAVHLGKAKQIVTDKRVSYSEVAWYPPFFHTILAVLQIFAGTLDVMVAALLLKLFIATLNVLILLSMYLLSRKSFGIAAAVASAVFTILSIPIFEMIFWGGYANFLGLSYIAFIFYILNKDLRVSVKTFLLFLGTFTIVLSHQLAALVFVLMFVPAFLVTSIESRKFLVFFAVILGGGLALMAWYARILFEHADILIYHIFFEMEENIYHISAVTVDSLIKNLGPTFFLALAGIPLTFVLVKKKKALKSSILIIFWLAVPFFLSQLYFFGIYLPYNRFIYFLATPITILSGVTIYCGLVLFSSFIESKAIQRIIKKSRTLNAAKILIIAPIFSLFFVQCFVFIQRIETYPQYYERASIASYNSGIWVKEHSIPDGTVIASRSPGSWFYIFSEHSTMEETDPLYSRNLVAEAVLYSFYEMENTHTLTREYSQESSDDGQSIYVSVYNIWTKSMNIPNNQVKVIYVNSVGEQKTISLSETAENIYWRENSTDRAQLISEYIHELFTVEKAVTFSSNSSVINVEWKIESHQKLANTKLAFTSYMEPSLDYKVALVPGVLDWQNPWDNATYIDPNEEWSVVEGSFDIIVENIVAILDEENGVLTAFEFVDPPDLFILGALDNSFIDALKLQYELGDLVEGENQEISFSILVYSFEMEEIEKWTVSDLKQQFYLQMNLPVQGRDFRTYIKEYNVKFVAVDTRQVLSNIEATPALDKVYNNGRIVVYATKR